mmetsp:Transcript_5580/g.13006  ORF Transcript_5580/g.13006 Transcript_5580/m.13006 type:complete len:223 (+) Transcript_5580:36-704(+)
MGVSSSCCTQLCWGSSVRELPRSCPSGEGRSTLASARSECGKECSGRWVEILEQLLPSLLSCWPTATLAHMLFASRAHSELLGSLLHARLAAACAAIVVRAADARLARAVRGHGAAGVLAADLAGLILRRGLHATEVAAKSCCHDRQQEPDCLQRSWCAALHRCSLHSSHQRNGRGDWCLRCGAGPRVRRRRISRPHGPRAALRLTAFIAESRGGSIAPSWV